ncbi:MAG: EXPERA domain-containing protein [Candidatus Heimdallarchaeota archaeon]
MRVTNERVPFKQRDVARKVLDIIILIFFFINIIFICYLFDIEQLVVSAEDHQYITDYGFDEWVAAGMAPLWPPKFIIRLNHFVGLFDQALMLRPTWWQATIWIDVILFGPFYIVGIIAFIRGYNWIRTPSIIWASMMLTNVTIIFIVEFVEYFSPDWWKIVLANLLWILIPILVLLRMILYPQTFSGDRLGKKISETK